MIDLKKIKIKTASKDYRLNLFSFVFLLLADCFLAIILFYGLSQQVDQLTNEFEYFPQPYRNIYISQGWVENNYLPNIARSVLNIERSIYKEDKKYKEMHPVCKKTHDSFLTLHASSEILSLFKQRDRLSKKYRNYDSFQKNRNPAAGNLLEQIEALDKKLLKHALVKETIDFINSQQKIDFSQEIRKHQKIYALKRSGLGFLFLLPIIVFLAWWNKRSHQKEKFLSVMISSHFFIVSALPIAFEIIRLVIEVIPKVLLEKIYEALKNLNLISFWYYGVIAISVIVTTWTIWFLQAKVFTQKRYKIKQILRGICVVCAMKIDYRRPFCPHCGHKHLSTCHHCDKDTLKDLPYCQHCGEIRQSLG